MPTKPKFWYIVFRQEDEKVVFGYFTKDYLKTTDHLIGTTVMHFESKPLPAKVEENTDYRYEGENIW